MISATITQFHDFYNDHPSCLVWFVLQIQYTGGAVHKVDESVSSSFKVLGCITLLQLSGSALLGVSGYMRERSKHKSKSMLDDNQNR